MRKIICVLAAMVAVGVMSQMPVVRANVVAAEEKEVTGVLMDNACGGGMMSKDDPEASAAKHTKACATKEACAKSGYAVISGKTILKFDDKGNELAKAFLAKTDKTTDLRVVVKGTAADGKIAVVSIVAAEAK